MLVFALTWQLILVKEGSTTSLGQVLTQKHHLPHHHRDHSSASLAQASHGTADEKCSTSARQVLDKCSTSARHVLDNCSTSARRLLERPTHGQCVPFQRQHWPHSPRPVPSCSLAALAAALTLTGTGPCASLEPALLLHILAHRGQRWAVSLVLRPVCALARVPQPGA